MRYDESILSDLHKDAYGFRPRASFWDAWEAMSEAERDEEWDRLRAALQESIDREKAEEALAVTEFEASIVEYISYGAADRETALRWMTQSEEFRDSQDVEHWIWKQGVLFTDLGRTLTAQLKAMWNLAY